jgi:hypothetical protein
MSLYSSVRVLPSSMMRKFGDEAAM